MALGRRQPAAGLIHAAARGSHDARGTSQALLVASGRCWRMRRKGDGLDNAVAERFFGRLTGERTSLRPDATRQAAWDAGRDDRAMGSNHKR
jgi:transposase InsO family protein